MNTQKQKVKPFAISKQLIFNAYKKVKANKGAAGIDKQSIAEFEENLKDNLYVLWNRMSSGCYFPPAVRAVEIPKKGKGTRTLGIPTVADRIAQTAVSMVLESNVEPLFHSNSYGYRPNRSALDAIEICRERCWRYSWVVDLDISKFFDTVAHEPLLEMVAKHTDQRWVMLYVQRWLKAPLQKADGTIEQRDCGTPQGSAISPVLANIFMHYVFDTWITDKFPFAPFERYADDVVVHCNSKPQANFIKAEIAKRLSEFGMKLHPDKTKTVYCKDDLRKEDHENIVFDFCGYTFRPRDAKNAEGKRFVGFLPAISNTALKAKHADIRAWKIGRHSDRTLNQIAEMINSVVRGWINYYGKFYPSAMTRLLKHINEMLIKWAMRKYKRLRTSKRRAWKWLYEISKREPSLFVHWSCGGAPNA